MFKFQNFINGNFVDPLGAKWIENIEPATGKVIPPIYFSDLFVCLS